MVTGCRSTSTRPARSPPSVGDGRVRLAVETDYPWSGRVRIAIREAPEAEWTLQLRVPAWATAGTIDWGTGNAEDVATGAREVHATRRWRAGDAVDLELAMPARITEPAPQVDAIRGCLALERGPLVYAIETADLPPGIDVEDVRLDPGARPEPVARPDLGTGVIGLSVAATTADGESLDLAAVPYHAWANRSVEAMRVWIPRTDLPGSDPRARG